MPELPEIETFRQRFLHGDNDSPSLVGRTITGISLLWARTLAEPTPDEFQTLVVGQKISDIDRRGKYLLIKLGSGTIAFHLMMSGDLLVESQSNPIAVHHRLLVNLDETDRLAFNDTRKFGRVWFTDDINNLLSHLGPEPLDEAFTADVFYAKLQARKRRIKPLLLDQGFIAGMGNIYTDETLFHAGIHPETRASSLSFKQVKILFCSIRKVLLEAIQKNGSSIDWIYRGGDFQNYFQVYQRTGKSCYKCGANIERIIVGQRGTHFCPHCQPVPGSK